jgi:hypothetical protein
LKLILDAVDYIVFGTVIQEVKTSNVAREVGGKVLVRKFSLTSLLACVYDGFFLHDSKLLREKLINS